MGKDFVICVSYSASFIFTALRGLGSIMILLVLGVVGVTYYVVVVNNYGPSLFDGGIDSLISLSFLIPFHCLLGMLLWSYFSVVFTDPGSVPPNWRPATDKERGETDPLNGSEFNSMQPDLSNQRIRYCRKCNQLKPSRCHHCSICGRCVLKMDHHCMDNFAIDQDMFSLKKECEEKDATIKELSTIVQSANMAGSKRISELEDIIRRKNTIITRLKKDMMVLEQKAYEKKTPKIERDAVIRATVIGTKWMEAEREFQALVSLEVDYLGPVA